MFSEKLLKLLLRSKSFMMFFLIENIFNNDINI